MSYTSSLSLTTQSLEDNNRSSQTCGGLSSRKRRLTLQAYEFVTVDAFTETVKQKCMRCSQTFSVNTSTTVKKHLRSHEYFLADASQKQFDMNGRLTPDLPLILKHMQIALENQPMKWVETTKQLISIVKNGYFIHLITHTKSSLKITSRKRLRCRVPESASKQRLTMKELLLQNRRKISLTANSCSSAVYRGYMVVTRH